jgi:hypothetical protein
VTDGRIERHEVVSGDGGISKSLEEIFLNSSLSLDVTVRDGSNA